MIISRAGCTDNKVKIFWCLITEDSEFSELIDFCIKMIISLSLWVMSLMSSEIAPWRADDIRLVEPHLILYIHILNQSIRPEDLSIELSRKRINCELKRNICIRVYVLSREL